uniref:pectinesterase n=1 Tax=Quercus lobata TaxID=97700 RepID=A0A7N2L4C6_QUELO
MVSPKVIFYVTLTLFLFLNVSKAQNKTSTKTIIVDKSGKGQFTTVQKAIDSIPSNNKQWTTILVNAGVYKEKVKITSDKQYIILKGKDRLSTVIEWDDSGNSLESSTFQLYASNFMARGITFKNTYNLVLVNDAGEKITWAPAALVNAEKASFYECGFVGIQDTLTDLQGRHYFYNCYIEGAVDFIWGFGQSLYQNSEIRVQSKGIGVGKAFITAQGRQSDSQASGFVFMYCKVTGTGPAYLGRAYKSYSTVVYYQSSFDNIIAPEGWDIMRQAGNEKYITFAEVQCKGPGANLSKRVKWEKTLSSGALQKFIDRNLFINQDNWIEEHLKHV